MTQVVAALLKVDDGLVGKHAHVFGDDAAGRCVALASALASSPAWARLRQGTRMSVRPEAGLVGIFGSVAPDDLPLMTALGDQVPDLLRRLLPVPYPDAERGCFVLAERIGSRLGPDELGRARIVAIPRGGLIVAGMLSYALGLSPTQVGKRATNQGVTILVDDCGISGRRLREWLARHAGRPLLVALLHAHEEFCRRVEQSSSSVIACLAAGSLRDHAPSRPGYEAWRRRWAERSPDDLWTGDPDHVVYPWNEPDVVVWNDMKGTADAGWRVVPPAWCIKNRAAFDPADVQLCEPVAGPLMPAREAIWAGVGGETVVARLGAPAAVVLRGTASAFWQAIVVRGSAAGAAEDVAGRYGASIETVRADLIDFVARLSERGLLAAA
jgi:hypothetical protein